MWRLPVALLLALCCHVLFILLPVSKEEYTAPRLPGTKRIKIYLSGIASVEAEAYNSKSVQNSSLQELYQDLVEVQSIIQSETKELQQKNSAQQIMEPAVQQQQSEVQVIIKPSTRKKQFHTATTADVAAGVPGKEKKTTRIPQPSKNIVNTKPASASAFVKAEPLYRQNPKPSYPALARRRGWQGTVILEVTVLKDGTPDQVTLHRSSGYELLDTSTLKTVKTWRFLPGIENGRSKSMKILIPVHFKLN